MNIFDLLYPPTPTVHSDSKSNMAARIHYWELLTLTRLTKITALQATASPKRGALVGFFLPPIILFEIFPKVGGSARSSAAMI